MALKLQFAGLSLGAAVDQQTGNLSVFDILQQKKDRVLVYLNSSDHGSRGLAITGYLQNENLLFPNLTISNYLGNYFEPDLNDEDWTNPKLPPKISIKPEKLVQKSKERNGYQELVNIFYSIKY